MSRPTPSSTRSEWARAVRRLSNRSFREKISRFLVEGPQSVREAVRGRPDSVTEVVVSECGSAPAREVASLAAAAGLQVTEVPEDLLLAICETVTPQGVAAICEFIDVPPAEALDSQDGPADLAVLFHEIRDPGNAGTVLRTADAAGAGAVLFSRASVDPYNGKCVRSSAGSLFHVRVSRDVDTAAAVEAARSAGMQVLATSLDAELELGQPAADRVLREPALWVFGSEAHGLTREIAEMADHRIRIPMYGAAESLNLAGAAAVCLYASALARRGPTLS